MHACCVDNRETVKALYSFFYRSFPINELNNRQFLVEQMLCVSTEAAFCGPDFSDPSFNGR